MRRLVPETLGKSIFRRFQRKTAPGLLERRDTRPGYAGLAKPLVWHTPGRGAGTSGLPFLRRRQRMGYAEEALAENPMDNARPEEQRETFAGENTAVEETVVQTPKIQRKVRPPARRTAVELPKSQSPEQGAQTAKIEASPSQKEASKPLAAAPLKDAPPPTREGETRNPSQAETTIYNPAPSVTAKPGRATQPETPEAVTPKEAVKQKAHQRQAAGTEKTVSSEKPVSPPETRPDALTLISRKKGSEPTLPQVNRKAEVKQTAEENRAKPAPAAKPSLETEFEPQGVESKPASEIKETLKAPPTPVVQPDSPNQRMVQLKPVEGEPAPMKQALPKPAAKPAPSIGKPPEAKPAFPVSDETPDRPRVQPSSPRLTHTQRKADRPQPDRQGPPKAELPQNPTLLARPQTTQVSQPKGVQRAQATPAKPEIPALNETQGLSEKKEGPRVEAVKPDPASTARRIETPTAKRLASSSNRHEPEVDRQTIVHARPATSAREPERKPGLSVPQTNRRPIQSFIQRDTEPSETASSPPPDAAAPSRSSVPETSPTPPIETTGKEGDSAKALDEMSRQVYEILQRRLRAEFERSHGTKI